MTLLSLLFWLLVGGTLQVLMPAWRYMGQPAFPFVLAVVLYAAMSKKSRYFVMMALLGGILEDSLSLAPLGFSGCALLAAGGVATLLRADFFTFRATAVSVLGALCTAVATGVMAMLLHVKGLIVLTPAETGWRMLGSALLGAIVVPVMFRLMQALERRLGMREEMV